MALKAPKRQPTILLLNLPINIDDPSDYNSVLQPAGLLSISAFLKQRGLHVILLDAFALHLTKKKILQKIAEIRPDILGITLFTNHLRQAIPFLGEVKRLLPATMIVAGGPHPSSAYDSFLDEVPEVDIAVIGEGEFTLLEIAAAVREGKTMADIDGVSFRLDGKTVMNPFRPFIEDLDSLPFGDWDSLPMDHYWEIWTVKKNYAHMILSRGCPFGCTFCGAKKALGRRQRRRSPGHVLEEIRLLYDRHGVRNILFGDSTFNMDHDWVHAICNGLLELDRPIIWNCNIRGDLVDRETVRLMKKSGLDRVFIGVESADDRMLARMKKGETIEKIEEGIHILQDEGIHPDLGFILGMPGETEDTMRKSIAFARRHKKSLCAFTLASPFPGTPLYAEAQKEGFIVSDWTKFDIYSIAYVPQGLNRETLERYYRKAVKSAYLRPSFILFQILRLRSPLNLLINMRFAFRIFFGRLLRLSS